MAFEPIKRLLPRSVASHGLTRELQARRVLELSVTVLQGLWGKERAQYLEPVSFHDGQLSLKVSSAAAKQQLSTQLTPYMNELNRQLGEKVIHKIILISKGF